MNRTVRIAVVLLVVVAAIVAIAHLPTLESLMRKIHGG